MTWFESYFGRNRDVLRGTEWEHFIRWPWEDDPQPGPHCVRGEAPSLAALTLWGIDL